MYLFQIYTKLLIGTKRMNNFVIAFFTKQMLNQKKMISFFALLIMFCAGFFISFFKITLLFADNSSFLFVFIFIFSGVYVIIGNATDSFIVERKDNNYLILKLYVNKLSDIIKGISLGLVFLSFLSIISVLLGLIIGSFFVSNGPKLGWLDYRIFIIILFVLVVLYNIAQLVGSFSFLIHNLKSISIYINTILLSVTIIYGFISGFIMVNCNGFSIWLYLISLLFCLIAVSNILLKKMYSKIDCMEATNFILY